METSLALVRSFHNHVTIAMEYGPLAHHREAGRRNGPKGRSAATWKADGFAGASSGLVGSGRTPWRAIVNTRHPVLEYLSTARSGIESAYLSFSSRDT